MASSKTAFWDGAQGAQPVHYVTTWRTNSCNSGQSSFKFWVIETRLQGSRPSCTGLTRHVLQGSRPSSTGLMKHVLQGSPPSRTGLAKHVLQGGRPSKTGLTKHVLQVGGICHLQVAGDGQSRAGRLEPDSRAVPEARPRRLGAAAHTGPARLLLSWDCRCRDFA